MITPFPTRATSKSTDSVVGTPISASSPSATPTQFGRFVAVRVQRRGSTLDGVQPNFQLRKGAAVSGKATSVTCEPAGNGAVHVGGQAIPAGSLTTLPVPLPPRMTRDLQRREACDERRVAA